MCEGHMLRLYLERHAMRYLSSLPLVGLMSSESTHAAVYSFSFIAPVHHSSQNNGIRPIYRSRATVTASRGELTNRGAGIRRRVRELSASSLDSSSRGRSSPSGPKESKYSRPSPWRHHSVGEVKVARGHDQPAVPRPPDVEHQRQLSNGRVGTNEPTAGICTLNSIETEGHSTDVAGWRRVQDAERMFRLGRALHLRRHRSPAARGIALKLFRDAMRIRPDWIATDSRFAVDSGINDVFAAFSCDEYDGTTSINRTGRGTGCGDERERDSVGAEVVVASLRAALDNVGYTAYRVQEKFGRAAAGPVQGQRLPGPYYLRKSIDHTHAKAVASLGPLRDGLDVAIRLFLLGLALRRTEVERFLGPEAIASADSLGITGECPVDPSLLVSLVQIFPLDADVQSPLPLGVKSIVADENDQSSQCNKAAQNNQGTPSDGNDGCSASGGLPGGSRAVLKSPSAGGKVAPDANLGAYSGISSPSNLLFATDWPPPGSTALIEEPVMYIGPDSIGLVQHTPRRTSLITPPITPPRDVGIGEGGQQYSEFSERVSSEDDASFAGSNAEGEATEQGESILDLCCGSGIQGIAAAVLRGGNAHVTCIDINPRAVRFSRFNACLNNLDLSRFTAVVGDLYTALDADVGNAAAAVQETDQFRRSKLKYTEADAGNFDLILANPPFIPVPPKLESATRRYDLFAAGGSTGEEVLREIFVGALDRLRPGGLLAVVSELANPAVFDVKLRTWIGCARQYGEPAMLLGGQNPAESTAARSALVAARHAEGFADEGHVESALSSAYGDQNGVAESEEGRQRKNGRASDDRWAGLVLHEKAPWSAKEYASRRAGSSPETEGWLCHLHRMGIDSMAAGFVFVRKTGERGTDRAGDDQVRTKEEGGDQNMADSPTVEVRGVDKVWAPHNTAAIEGSKRALRKL